MTRKNIRTVTMQAIYVLILFLMAMPLSAQASESGLKIVNSRMGGQSQVISINKQPSVRHLEWKKMKGFAKEVSGSNGNIFFLSRTGTVWRYKGKNNWEGLGGKFIHIAAGGSGHTAWALDPLYRVYRYKNGVWARLHPRNPGFAGTQQPLHAVQIASGSNNQLWGRLSNNTLVEWDAVHSFWVKPTYLPFPTLAIVIGPANDPWIIDDKGGVRWLSKGKWKHIPGITATSIGVGGQGAVFVTDRQGNIFWLNGKLQWKPAKSNIKMHQIAVGWSGNPWAMTLRGQLMATKGFLKAEKQKMALVEAAKPKPPAVLTFPLPSLAKLNFGTIKGQLKDIGIGINGSIYAVGSNGGLFCFSNPGRKFILASSGENSRIGVATNGDPWVLSNAGLISHYDSRARRWQLVPGFTGKDIAVSPDNNVWAIGTDGGSYLYNKASRVFQRQAVLSSNVSFKGLRIASGDRMVSWVVTDAKQLMRCDHGNCRLALSGASDVAVAPDNTVFALDMNGFLRRYSERLQSFKQTQNKTVKGVSLAVGPQGRPWLVQQTGGVQHAGLIYPGSKRINTASCARAFTLAPTPKAISSLNLKAVNDTASLAPGASLNLLSNDSLSGRSITLSDVAVSLNAGSSGLTLVKGSVKVPANARVGTTLRASYQICPTAGFGTCSTAKINIKVISSVTVPSAPTGVSAVAGNGQATVSFTAPSNGGSAITGYTVTASTGQTATGTSASIVVTGLTNGTPVTFTVKASNAVGTGAASAVSNSVTPVAAATVPGAPTGVSAVAAAGAGATSVTVSFSAPTSDGGSTITSYTVTSSPGGITASGTSSPIVVTGLTTATPYTFTVTATNAQGTGAASAASNSATPGG